MTTTSTNSGDERLSALGEALIALTTDPNLESILKRVAEIAGRLIKAKYAALGVPDGQGGLAQFITYGISDDELLQMDRQPRGRGLLRELLTRETPLRVEDMSKDSRSIGFCPRHPHMTSFLGVPIISKGKHLGNLYLSDREDGQPFTEEDEQLISLLAANAAIAIENARTSDQLRRLAVIEERDRISMELHDGIIQAIYAIGIKLELMRLKHTDDTLIAGQITEVNTDLNRVIDDLRRYITNLRAGVEYTITLREQLEEIAERFRQVSTARLVMDVSRSFAGLTESHVHALVQITREALSNIVRHASATEVYFDLHETPSHIALVISDNGVGFDPNTVQPGIGLHNIRQRVRHRNGTVEFIAKPGRGVTIQATLPI